MVRARPLLEQFEEILYHDLHSHHKYHHSYKYLYEYIGIVKT